MVRYVTPAEGTLLLSSLYYTDQHFRELHSFSCTLFDLAWLMSIGVFGLSAGHTGQRVTEFTVTLVEAGRLEEEGMEALGENRTAAFWRH